MLHKLGPFLRPKVPHSIHILVLHQVLGDVVPGTRQDVDHPPGQVTGLKHLYRPCLICVGIVCYTWYRSSASIGYFSLGITTTELDLAMAAPIRDTKLSSGDLSGQAIPIIPTGSCILITVPIIYTFSLLI